MYPTAAELLPPWWRGVWVVLLLLVVAVLARSVMVTAGRSRAWHLTYAAAGLGMIVMYAANPMDTPGLNGPALVVLVGALIGLAALVVTALRDRRSGTPVSAPWVVAAADVVTLAYIQIPADVRPVIICVLFACYLAVQVGLRLTVGVRALRGTPQRASRGLVDPGGRPTPATGTGEGGPSRRGEAAVPLALAVLGLGMLYMLSV